MTRITDEDQALWRARYGGPSAARLEAKASGKRERIPGKKWLGDRLVDDEETEQQRLFDLLALPMVRRVYPELEYFHHVPNGGARPGKTAGVLRATGVVSGALDCRFDARRPFPRWTGEVRYSELEVHRLRGPRPPVLVGSIDKFTHASGLVIEMKAGDGQPSNEQASWLVWLADQGFACFVAWTGVDAFNVTALYLDLPFFADAQGHVQREKNSTADNDSSNNQDAQRTAPLPATKGGRG